MRTFAVDGPMRIRLEFPTKKKCPFADEVDEVTVVIRYIAGEKAIELHELAAYLSSFENTPLSHEDFAQAIRTRLDNEAISATVEVQFVTAGITGFVKVPPGNSGSLDR